MEKDRILSLVSCLKEKSALFTASLNEQIEKCNTIAQDHLNSVQEKCQILEEEVDVQLREIKSVQQNVATLNALLVEMAGYLEDL
jgi:SPX domain protein involved in polyphosphate accumulation